MDIETRSLTKTYPLKCALKDVSIFLEGGKIHAFVGENGAGKSTLAGLLSGNLPPSGGQIMINGKEVSFKSSGDALKRKIILVQQRPFLADSLSAWENIMLKTASDKEKGRFLLSPPSGGLLQLKEQWCPQLNMNAKVRDLGGNMRFYISLIGSLLRKPECLILDEPSAFLSADERKTLYERLKEYATLGMNIIVITHSFSEAVNYPDTISLLEEGQLVKQFFSREEYKNYKQNFSTGESARFSHNINHSPLRKNSPCIRLSSASVSSKNKPALLKAGIEAFYGEITAVTGVKEAAMETLEDLLTGMEDGRESGTFEFTEKNGRTHKLVLSHKKLGVPFLRSKKTAIVPSDKSFRASNPELTVTQMLSVYAQKSKQKQKNTLAASLIQQAGIKINPDEPCSALSGGMLQRLILARELSTDPDLIILCNPMHGLDIKSQGLLCRKLDGLAAEGKAVLIIGAEDFPLSLCSRVYSLESGTTSLAYPKEAI